MFGGGVWGTRLGSDVPQRRHEQNTSPKRSIRRGLGDVLGDAAGDALSCRSQPHEVVRSSSNVLGILVPMKPCPVIHKYNRVAN